MALINLLHKKFSISTTSFNMLNENVIFYSNETKKRKKDKCKLIVHVIFNITKCASFYLPPFLVAFLSASLRKNVNAKIGSKQFTFTLRVDLIFLKLTWHIHKKKFWILEYEYLSFWVCMYVCKRIASYCISNDETRMATVISFF